MAVELGRAVVRAPDDDALHPAGRASWLRMA